MKTTSNFCVKAAKSSHAFFVLSQKRFVRAVPRASLMKSPSEKFGVLGENPHLRDTKRMEQKARIPRLCVFPSMMKLFTGYPASAYSKKEISSGLILVWSTAGFSQIPRPLSLSEKLIKPPESFFG